MFKVGEFSKLTNVTVRTLHHYDEVGLIRPIYTDNNTKYRYYSAKQIERINEIKALQQIGFSLVDIKEIINGDNPTVINQYYSDQERQLIGQINELNDKLSLLRAFKDTDSSMDSINKYNVAIKTIPERKVVYVRENIPTYNDEKLLWNKLYKKFENNQLKAHKEPYWLAVYHDSAYQENNPDIEVQVRIADDIINLSTENCKIVPEQTIASVTFAGSYEQMPNVTQALALWIEAHNYKISGPMICIFYVTPAQTSQAEQWITEVGYLVHK
ncbi:MerR family transcriptional regulator [Mollicutes bacterium LVI A0039]|nr:MerR family transcriptional regulator [Mollicutes bacterium LVI A0039]